MTVFTGIPLPYSPDVNRDLWLTARREGIGASDVASILGVSPWGSAYQVWADKTGRLADEDRNVTDGMVWGRLLENTILDAWTARDRMATIHRNSLFRHQSTPWMQATVDGVVVADPSSWELSDAVGLAEVKTDGYTAWPDDEPPTHYEIQAQWQMLVTGMTRVWFPVLHGGRRLMVYETKAHPELQERLAEEMAAFWTDHVLADRPPPAQGSDVGVIGRIAGYDPDKEVTATSRIEEAWTELVDAKAAEKHAVLRVKELQAEIQAFMEDADTLLDADGRPIVTWRESPREGYTVEAGVTRRFLIKERKR
jgi:putative phage-type endonuclease